MAEIITIKPPQTTTDTKYVKISQTTKIAPQNTLVQDQYHGTQIHYWAQVIPSKLIDRLSNYIEENESSLGSSTEDCRGKHQVLFVGNWTNRGK